MTKINALMTHPARSASLPFLVSIFPVIFLYSLNADALSLNMLWLPLAASLALAGLAFAILYFALKKQLVKASNCAAVLLLFFFLYGPLYTWLLSMAAFPVKQRFLLPLFALAALGAFWLVLRARAESALRINRAAWLILLGLILYNAGAAVPKEIEKNALRRAESTASKQAVSAAGLSTPTTTPAKRPDIYFIILDEFAGPKAMREFWGDHQVDTFIAALRSKGFFVAEASRSPNRSTLTEIASRLNLKNISSGSTPELFEQISDNQVMRLLKSYGYTTVVFDGTRESYPTKPKINADFDLTYSANQSDPRWTSVNDFSLSVLDMTALRFLSKEIQKRTAYAANHRKAVQYTFERAGDLSDISSPKFVYAHILAPHVPFVFDENGSPLNLDNPLDWHYYLGQYKFTMRAAETLVDRLIASSDPGNRPIIILQSDHGARNKVEAHSIVLENYSETYMHDILNALYLPGYDTSRLPDDLNPHKTFEMILNHYFNAGVTYQP